MIASESLLQRIFIDFMAKPQTLRHFTNIHFTNGKCCSRFPKFNQLVGGVESVAAPTRVDFSTIFIAISWELHRLHKQDVYEFIEETYEFVASVEKAIMGYQRSN